MQLNEVAGDTKQCRELDSNQNYKLARYGLFLENLHPNACYTGFQWFVFREFRVSFGLLMYLGLWIIKSSFAWMEKLLW